MESVQAKKRTGSPHTNMLANKIQQSTYIEMDEKVEYHYSLSLLL